MNAGLLRAALCLIVLSPASIALAQLPGDETTILGSSGQSTLVAADDDAWDALNKAVLVKDPEELLKWLATGRVFPVSSGTRVRILTVWFTCFEVRVLDGKYAGRSGFVNTEFVKRSGSPGLSFEPDPQTSKPPKRKVESVLERMLRVGRERSQRLSEAQREEQEGEFELALQDYGWLVGKYPERDEGKIAAQRIKAIQELVAEASEAGFDQGTADHRIRSWKQARDATRAAEMERDRRVKSEAQAKADNARQEAKRRAEADRRRTMYLKLGKEAESGGRRQEAIFCYETLARDYAGSPEAKFAAVRLKSLATR